MAASKGIAAGLAIPWISVPTLDALAWGYDCFDGAVAPIIDGRKGRVYSAVYLHGRKATDWLDIPLAKLAALLDTYPRALATGPDAELFRGYALERSGFRVDERARTPAARAIAMLGLERIPGERAGEDRRGPPLFETERGRGAGLVANDPSPRGRSGLSEIGRYGSLWKIPIPGMLRTRSKSSNPSTSRRSRRSKKRPRRSPRILLCYPKRGRGA